MVFTERGKAAVIFCFTLSTRENRFFVVTDELPGECDTLSDTVGKLAREGINSNYVYDSANKGGESPAIMFVVSDLEKE